MKLSVQITEKSGKTAVMSHETTSMVCLVKEKNINLQHEK